MSCPTSVSLAEFIEDMRTRREFLGSWAETGVPKLFNLSALLHPHAFITAIQQVSSLHEFMFSYLRIGELENVHQ